MSLADDENCLGIVPNKSLKFMCGKCKYNLTRTNENNTDSSIISIIGNCFEKEPAPATFSFKSQRKHSSHWIHKLNSRIHCNGQNQNRLKRATACHSCSAFCVRWFYQVSIPLCTLSFCDCF